MPRKTGTFVIIMLLQYYSRYRENCVWKTWCAIRSCVIIVLLSLTSRVFDGRYSSPRMRIGPTAGTGPTYENSVGTCHFSRVTSPPQGRARVYLQLHGIHVCLDSVVFNLVVFAWRLARPFGRRDALWNNYVFSCFINVDGGVDKRRVINRWVTLKSYKSSEWRRVLSAARR